MSPRLSVLPSYRMSENLISSVQSTDLQAAQVAANITADLLARQCKQELFLITAVGAAVTECLSLDPSFERKGELCAEAFACLLATPATLLQHLTIHAHDLEMLNEARRHAETETKAAGS